MSENNYHERLRESTLMGEQARQDAVAALVAQLQQLPGQTVTATDHYMVGGIMTEVAMTSLDGVVVTFRINAKGPEVEW